MHSPSDVMIAQDIVQRIGAVRDRIAQASARAGRSEGEVTLVAVTKTFPVEVVQAARRAGIVDFGENRVQELEEKVARVPGAVQGGPVNWHLVGSLQRNKARKAVEMMDCFHALDSIRLARELDKRAEAAGRRIPCFVQVNMSREETKSGFSPDEVPGVLDDLRPFGRLELVGLMTLAAPADDPEEVRPQFAGMRELLHRCVQRNPGLFAREGLSMGMSGDFEAAVEEGATHVRLGTALFGERDYGTGR